MCRILLQEARMQLRAAVKDLDEGRRRSLIEGRVAETEGDARAAGVWAVQLSVMITMYYLNCTSGVVRDHNLVEWLVSMACCSPGVRALLRGGHCP